MRPTETLSLRQMAERAAAWWTRFLQPAHMIDAAVSFHRAGMSAPSAVSVAALRNAGALARTHLAMNPDLTERFHSDLERLIYNGRGVIPGLVEMAELQRTLDGHPRIKDFHLGMTFQPDPIIARAVVQLAQAVLYNNLVLSDELLSLSICSLFPWFTMMHFRSDGLLGGVFVAEGKGAVPLEIGPDLAVIPRLRVVEKEPEEHEDST